MLLGTLRPLVIGQNALAVERIWDQMYRSNRHSRASHFMMAISYIDNALWDLRGRHFGAPVFRLLGGPTQLPVRVYGSCLGFSIDPAARRRNAPRSSKKDGFIHQKWFLGYGPGDGARGMDLNVQLVKELREAVGEDVQIMFDAYQGWDLQYALEWCRKVEQYRPYFVEEAVPMSDLESFIRLSKSTTVPIATGEHLYGRWEAEQFFKADALQFIQADPEWCGGVSETVKIAHLASVHGVKLLPHCHNVHAALHIVASQSPAVCPFGEYLINHVPEKLHFMKDPLLTTQRAGAAVGEARLRHRARSGESGKAGNTDVRSEHTHREEYPMRHLFAFAIASLSLLVAAHAADITASRQTAASKQARAGEAEFRALYKELVEINTTLSVGSCTKAANAMKARLERRGLSRTQQLHVIVPPDRPKDGNLVAVLPGTRREAQAAAAARAHRRGRGEPRRLGARSVHARRGRRLLLRARLVGRQGDGGGVHRLHGPLQAGRLPAEARHQARAHLRRGNAERVQRREVPHRESPRSHRRRRSRSTKAAAAATTRRPACIATSRCSPPRRSTRTSR